MGADHTKAGPDREERTFRASDFEGGARHKTGFLRSIVEAVIGDKYAGDQDSTSSSSSSAGSGDDFDIESPPIGVAQQKGDGQNMPFKCGRKTNADLKLGRGVKHAAKEQTLASVNHSLPRPRGGNNKDGGRADSRPKGVGVFRRACLKSRNFSSDTSESRSHSEQSSNSSHQNLACTNKKHGQNKSREDCAAVLNGSSNAFLSDSSHDIQGIRNNSSIEHTKFISQFKQKHGKDFSSESTDPPHNHINSTDVGKCNDTQRNKLKFDGFINRNVTPRTPEENRSHRTCHHPTVNFRPVQIPIVQQPVIFHHGSTMRVSQYDLPSDDQHAINFSHPADINEETEDHHISASTSKPLPIPVPVTQYMREENEKVHTQVVERNEEKAEATSKALTTSLPLKDDSRIVVVPRACDEGEMKQSDEHLDSNITNKPSAVHSSTTASRGETKIDQVDNSKAKIKQSLTENIPVQRRLASPRRSFKVNKVFVAETSTKVTSSKQLGAFHEKDGNIPADFRGDVKVRAQTGMSKFMPKPPQRIKRIEDSSSKVFGTKPTTTGRLSNFVRVSKITNVSKNEIPEDKLRDVTSSFPVDAPFQSNYDVQKVEGLKKDRSVSSSGLRSTPDIRAPCPKSKSISSLKPTPQRKMAGPNVDVSTLLSPITLSRILTDHDQFMKRVNSPNADVTTFIRLKIRQRNDVASFLTNNIAFETELEQHLQILTAAWQKPMSADGFHRFVVDLRTRLHDVKTSVDINIFRQSLSKLKLREMNITPLPSEQIRKFFHESSERWGRRPSAVLFNGQMFSHQIFVSAFVDTELQCEDGNPCCVQMQLPIIVDVSNCSLNGDYEQKRPAEEEQQLTDDVKIERKACVSEVPQKDEGHPKDEAQSPAAPEISGMSERTLSSNNEIGIRAKLSETEFRVSESPQKTTSDVANPPTNRSEIEEIQETPFDINVDPAVSSDLHEHLQDPAASTMNLISPSANPICLHFHGEPDHPYLETQQSSEIDSEPSNAMDNNGDKNAPSEHATPSQCEVNRVLCAKSASTQFKEETSQSTDKQDHSPSEVLTPRPLGRNCHTRRIVHCQRRRRTDKPTTQLKIKFCLACGDTKQPSGDPLLQCATCDEAFFCSPKCQRSSRNEHRESCRGVKRNFCKHSRW